MVNPFRSGKILRIILILFFSPSYSISPTLSFTFTFPFFSAFNSLTFPLPLIFPFLFTILSPSLNRWSRLFTQIIRRLWLTVFACRNISMFQNSFSTRLLNTHTFPFPSPSPPFPLSPINGQIDIPV